MPAGPAEDTDTCLCSATIQNLNPRSTREPAEPYDRRLKVDLIYPPHLLLSSSIKASDCFRFMKTVIKKLETLMAPWTMGQTGS